METEKGSELVNYSNAREKKGDNWHVSQIILAEF